MAKLYEDRWTTYGGDEVLGDGAGQIDLGRDGDVLDGHGEGFRARGWVGRSLGVWAEGILPGL